jgi:hypothetical protein
MLKKSIAVALALIAAFLTYGSLHATTKEDIIQAIEQEKAQVNAALEQCKYTAELTCDTNYWAHNMLKARYENGKWYYTCYQNNGATWAGNGVQATNIYWYGSAPDLYN